LEGVRKKMEVYVGLRRGELMKFKYVRGLEQEGMK
jgi:hypothetical protein